MLCMPLFFGHRPEAAASVTLPGAMYQADLGLGLLWAHPVGRETRMQTDSIPGCWRPCHELGREGSCMPPPSTVSVLLSARPALGSP